MVYQYNKITKKSQEVKLPAGSKLRDQEWVEKLNAFSRQVKGNNFYSTEIIIEEEEITNEEMDTFFAEQEEEELIDA